MQPGVRTVRVPASSANLGPGFDSLGLALAVHDVVHVEPLPAGLEIEVHGEGAAEVPRDENHLVVRALRAGLAHAGVTQPGLRLDCHNAVPHGRGLGSSASAVVAGLVAARSLLTDARPLDDDTVLDLAEGFEGHPDNVAASLFGSFTVSWVDAEPRRPRAVRLEVHPDVVPVACVPAEELSTSKARAMLPAEVPHADAAFNAGRAALLVEALTRRPELLLPATADRLHQEQRASAMPAAVDLVHRLRAEGLAAVVSGAGPTVLVFTVGAAAVASVDVIAGSRWRVLTPGVDTQGTCLIAESSILT
ncbi:MAG: homoserine kinase [Actinomycetales bacterium]|nr:homoserine kinase [Actinomycetales bacterium]